MLDRGPGLPPGAREMIFSPGFTTKEGGSGLGLSVVRRTMHDMQGSVAAGDRPGGGAAFTLRLPMETTNAAADRT